MPDQIEKTAAELLDMNPDPVPKYLLMRDFLAYRFSAGELMKARTDSCNSPAFVALASKQSYDGSWGNRFHYHGKKINDAAISTETAIVRLQSLGADRNSEILKPTIRYMEKVLRNKNKKNSVLETQNQSDNAFRLIVAARLRELVPEHPLALAYAEKLLNIINHSFAAGHFDETSFAEATENILGTRLSTDCEICFSIYPLILLQGLVDYNLEKLWIHHMIYNRRGINFVNNKSLRYLPLSFPSAESMRYLNALYYLLIYPTAAEYLSDAADWLWDQASYEGLWDLGNYARDGLILPLSANWRKPRSRQIDSSIRILYLLKRFQTTCSIRDSICHPI